MSTYVVTFTNTKGEQREVVVSLEDADPDLRAFLARNRVTRPGAGSPGGPIERMIAYTIARKQVPSEFVYDIEAPDCCRRVN